MKHEIVYTHSYDEDERAFWRSHPDSGSRWANEEKMKRVMENRAWTASCSCGAGVAIDNSPPGFRRTLLVRGSISKDSPCTEYLRMVELGLKVCEGLRDDLATPEDYDREEERAERGRVVLMKEHEENENNQRRKEQ